MLSVFTFLANPPLWFVPLLLLSGFLYIISARKWIKSRPLVYISDYEYDTFRQMYYRKKGGDGPFCTVCLNQDSARNEIAAAV